MINQLLHTVDGLRDIHPVDTLKKNNIEKNFGAMFAHYGYEQIQTPTFEYFDIYHDKRGTDNGRNLYKFFNREGDILALRPDVTPSIARYMATFHNHEKAPKRFSYIGNVFYNNENYQGKLREYTQAGVECIGIQAPDADAECIALAVNAILSSGLSEFQIDIGHVGYFNGLVEEAGFDDSMAEDLRSLIDEKNYIGLEEVLAEHEIPDNIKTALIDLPKLFGDASILDKAASYTSNPKSGQAIDRIRKVYEILSDYDVTRYVSFDLGMVSKLNYYTGLIFKGYTYDVGDSIVDGGRYDRLLGTFSYDAPAVGFAIKTDEVMNALARQQIQVDIKRIDTLIVYDEANRRVAIKLAETLRRQGMTVELGIDGLTMEESIAYGKNKEIGGMMVIKDSDKIELRNLSTDEVSDARISDLVEGGL